jgi:hypothetical protein
MYVDRVLETKSPLAAIDQTKGITCILFDRHKIEGDSLMVLLGWENHDSGEVALKFKAGTRMNSLTLGVGELQYAIVNRDTLLTIYWPDEKTKVQTATVYKKSPVKSNELASGLEYFINKGLVAGNYITTDSNSVTSKVSFRTNGTVQGLRDYKTYHINNDLDVEPMDNLDDIGFGGAEGIRYKRYSFKILGDTLKLYATKPNADSSLSVLDKLEYTLIKQK